MPHATVIAASGLNPDMEASRDDLGASNKLLAPLVPGQRASNESDEVTLTLTLTLLAPLVPCQRASNESDEVTQHGPSCHFSFHFLVVLGLNRALTHFPQVSWAKLRWQGIKLWVSAKASDQLKAIKVRAAAGLGSAIWPHGYPELVS